MEYVRNFTADWKEASFDARFALLTMLAMTVAMGAFTVIGFWYISVATIKYASESGDSLLVLFGQQAMIVAAFTAFVWVVISGDIRRQRREEHEEAARQMERSASIRSARTSATVMRLKVAVGVQL